MICICVRWKSSQIPVTVCFPLLSCSAIYDVVEEKVDPEPDFQYIPEKSPQDPAQLDQHALRDSMVALKEGLGGGAILAQFDVRTRKKFTRTRETAGSSRWFVIYF